MLPIWFLQFAAINNLSSTINFIVDGNKVINDLPHFWSSTGFCPPDPHERIPRYLSSSDMVQNIAYIGSLPMFDKNLKRQVRVNWLLDLIQLKRISDNSEYIEYNYDNLDTFIQLLYDYNLKPGFILEGNPSKYFKSFSDRINIGNSERELIIWWDIVKSIASRYINKYGIEYVESWNFESWNEPDMKDFDGINNMTIKSFVNYFYASYQGLMESSTDRKLHIIGPNERCLPISNNPMSSYCWTLIDKMIKIIANDKDRLKMSFSFHSKSGRLISNKISKDLYSNDYEDSVDIRSIIDKEQTLIREMLKRSQDINLPILNIMNNQADIEIDWSKPREWKGDTTYAGLVVKSIAQHIETYFIRARSDKINFTLLSHDNAFLSYHPHNFIQQTLLSRFQINNTTPNYVTLIKKPIYSAYGLLSLLGDKLIDTKTISADQTVDSDNVNIISTVSENDDEKIYSLLYINSLNKPRYSGDNISVTINTTLRLTFDDLSNDWKIVRYTIDNIRTNPYKVWKDIGSKPYLNTDILNKIKDAADPYTDIGPKDIDIKYSPIDGRPITDIAFDMSLPSVSMVLICSMKNNRPEKITGLKIILINDKNQVLLTWKQSKSRCVKTYEIEYKSMDATSFTRINRGLTTIFPSFHFINSKENSVKGLYRVRQVDMFDRYSEYSDVLNYF